MPKKSRFNGRLFPISCTFELFIEGFDRCNFIHGIQLNTCRPRITQRISIPA